MLANLVLEEADSQAKEWAEAAKKLAEERYAYIEKRLLERARAGKLSAEFFPPEDDKPWHERNASERSAKDPEITPDLRERLNKEMVIVEQSCRCKGVGRWCLCPWAAVVCLSHLKEVTELRKREAEKEAESAKTKKANTATDLPAEKK